MNVLQILHCTVKNYIYRSKYTLRNNTLWTKSAKKKLSGFIFSKKHVNLYLCIDKVSFYVPIYWMQILHILLFATFAILSTLCLCANPQTDWLIAIQSHVQNFLYCFGKLCENAILLCIQLESFRIYYS